MIAPSRNNSLVWENAENTSPIIFFLCLTMENHYTWNRGFLQASIQVAMVASSFKCTKETETLVQLRLYKTWCLRLPQPANICPGSYLMLLESIIPCSLSLIFQDIISYVVCSYFLAYRLTSWLYSRFLLRVCPAEVVCYASEEEITRAISPLVEKYFPKESPSGHKVTCFACYVVWYKNIGQSSRTTVYFVLHE
jgi:hypothetical protein